MRDMYTCTYDDEPTANSSDFSVENLQQRPDFHAQNLSKPWSKYIRVSLYNKKRNYPTLVDNNANFSLASTLFTFNADGISNNQDLGRLDITWYVEFHRPNIDLS